MEEKITDMVTDEILSELPIDLLVANIKDQINTPQSTVNYIEHVLERLESIEEEYMAEPEKREEYLTIKNDLAHTIVDLVCEAYDISVDSENIWGDDAMDLAEALYTFFVMDYQDTIQRFFYKYIKKHKKEIASMFKGDEKRDFTTLSTKKKIKDKDLAIIAINIFDVVNYIIDMDTDEDEFVELAGENDSMSKHVIQKHVTAGTMFGNFADNMIDKLNDDFLFIKESIAAYIQSKLIKKIEK